MKRSSRFFLLQILIFSGLLFAFSARAGVCPTASPFGVGCTSEGGQQYYCNSGCRLMDAGYCPINSLTPVSPCAALDACGVCSSCNANYLLCTANAYPNRTCTYNDPALHCASLRNSNCNAGECASCVSGYSLCATNYTCVATKSCQPWETFNPCTNACEGTASPLKLSFDSAGNGNTGNTILQSANPVLLISSGSLVGIGTTTPEARLEVVPASGYSILAGSFKIGNVALPTLDSDAATKGYVDAAITAGALPSGTISQTLRHNGTTWIADSNLFNNSTNVGIGTTNPQRKLEVLGDLMLSSTVDSTMYNLSIVPYYIEEDNIGYKFITNSSVYGLNNPLIFTGTGNVGIGTTTPATALDLGGGINFTNTNSSYQFYSPNAKIIQVSDSVQSVLNLVSDIDTDGGVLGAISFSRSAGQVDAHRNVAGILGVQRGTGLYAGGELQFWTKSSGALAQAMVIDTIGEVGIGTLAPNAALEVIPSSGYAILAGNYKIGNVALPTDNADAATKGYVDSIVSSLLWLPTGTNGQTLRHDGSSWVANSNLFNNGTNIGIGTVTPGAQLAVSGQIVVGADTDIADPYGPHSLYVRGLSGRNILAIGNDDETVASAFYVSNGADAVPFQFGTLTNSRFGFFTNNGTPTVVIDPNGGATIGAGFTTVPPVNGLLVGGNVGIGTTAPDTILHVKKTASGIINQLTLENLGSAIGNNGSGIFFKGYQGSNALITAYGDPSNTLGGGLQFQTYSDDTTANVGMVINRLGNVGIGTTTPEASLEIIPLSGYSILAGSSKIGNVALPTADTDVVTLGFLNSALSSVSASAAAVYSASTPATYNGSQSGYSGANALCAATVTGSHVCTTGEIMNTINSGVGSTIPTGSTLWITNGPPGFTANANDCIGWTSAVSGNYGTVWIKLASGDGFGSLNGCNTPRSFACCK